MNKHKLMWGISLLGGLVLSKTALGSTPPSQPPSLLAQTTTDSGSGNPLDLSPELQESPLLQRWREEIPNVLQEIRQDPSFRTRLRLGYTQFLVGEDRGGISVGVQDLFIGRTGLTLSGDYQTDFDGDRSFGGGDLHYYLLPLGSYINIAPTLGYRYLDTDDYASDGVNVGVRLMLALSRTGAADLALTQSFISPGGNEEVGITTLSIGYAVNSHLRLSTDIQQQNSRAEKDRRIGIVLEWMPSAKVNIP